MTDTAGSGGRDARDCSVTRAAVTRSPTGADGLGGSFGAERAQRGETLRGSVDRGWRVELFPSRVGTIARLHLRDPEIRDPEILRDREMRW